MAGPTDLVFEDGLTLRAATEALNEFKGHSIKKRLLAVVLIGLGIFSLVAGGSLIMLDLYSRQALHVEDGRLVKITQGCQSPALETTC